MLRPGLNGSVGGLGAVEDLQAVAGRVVEHDQVLDVPLLGERARAARDLGAGGLDPRREGVERGGVRDLPAEEADALAAVGVDDEPLLAVVHAEGERRTALVDALQAEEARCRRSPSRPGPWRGPRYSPKLRCPWQSSVFDALVAKK